MPRISAFYGVVIYMYWNERDHPLAHFHAYHAGRRASVSVDGIVLAGTLEPRALVFVRDWAKLLPARLRPECQSEQVTDRVLGDERPKRSSIAAAGTGAVLHEGLGAPAPGALKAGLACRA